MSEIWILPPCVHLLFLCCPPTPSPSPPVTEPPEAGWCAPCGRSSVVWCVTGRWTSTWQSATCTMSDPRPSPLWYVTCLSVVCLSLIRRVHSLCSMSPVLSVSVCLSVWHVQSVRADAIASVVSYLSACLTVRHVCSVRAWAIASVIRYLSVCLTGTCTLSEPRQFPWW